ncbi:hypothetical protein AF6_0312 [Anoxybacillus flavithermus TNO-09.006]|uniref:Uncharacterized protein n=2 Tax=Anoxybacillus flavithermus TaxID=33934 RepID=A0AAX1ZYH2_9BACL|nr:hypothetical protein CA592_12570 [Anoxybacillus flavithermus]ELK23049.1 hypothetical protein AF6_0312 [Anoxybacillus flavithermus TNO-09.006]RWU11975.1 hypothetical protein EA138_09730 [Anoxybacillus flavithermus]
MRSIESSPFSFMEYQPYFTQIHFRFHLSFLLLLRIKHFNIEHSEHVTGGHYATTSFFHFN